MALTDHFHVNWPIHLATGGNAWRSRSRCRAATDTHRSHLPVPAVLPDPRPTTGSPRWRRKTATTFLPPPARTVFLPRPDRWDDSRLPGGASSDPPHARDQKTHTDVVKLKGLYYVNLPRVSGNEASFHRAASPRRGPVFRAERRFGHPVGDVSFQRKIVWRC